MTHKWMRTLSFATGLALLAAAGASAQSAETTHTDTSHDHSPSHVSLAAGRCIGINGCSDRAVPLAVDKIQHCNVPDRLKNMFNLLS